MDFNKLRTFLVLLGLEAECIAETVERARQGHGGSSNGGAAELLQFRLWPAILWHHHIPPQQPLELGVVGAYFTTGLDVGPQVGWAGVRSAPPADGVHRAARCDPRALRRGKGFILADAQFERREKRVGVGVFGIDVNTTVDQVAGAARFKVKN